MLVLVILDLKLMFWLVELFVGFFVPRLVETLGHRYPCCLLIWVEKELMCFLGQLVFADWAVRYVGAYNDRGMGG